ncbi:MAG: signal peptidase I [Clostridia bacterium]|nr:signal peptidase I [Clostridia bacterium]
MKQILKNKVANEILEWVLCFVIAYVIYTLINFFIGTIAGIKQSSMYPTAVEGERVLVGRRILFNKTILRGDIVTLEAPIETAEYNKEDIYAKYEQYSGVNWFIHDVLDIGKKSYIKRVIAVGGDKLFISEQGEVFINDELLEETYLTEGLKTTRTGEYYELVVPENHVFVMGDNREGSMDSRVFGVVPLEKIDGKVHIRIWPLNKIGEI